MTDPGMVIVGAGHAGARAAHALRANGWRGGITLVESEDTIPYERPPLSKAVLSGKNRPEQFPIFSVDFFAQHSVQYQRSKTVVSINRQSQSVTLSDGSSLVYHRLLLAPGAEPRRLSIPGTDLEKVSFLRSAADAHQLASWLVAGTRVVVIGGGLIGLEAAASAIARQCQVTIVEFASRLMNRAVPEGIAHATQSRHVKEGVQLRLGCAVEEILGADSVSAVRLSTGEVIACDVVLISIGVVPRTSLAESAGLMTANGIAVDKFLRTSDPAIFAAGDACSFDDGDSGERIRLECWKNAEDQAVVAARNMLGGEHVYKAVPWMWSDQYEHIIQIAGHPGRAVSHVQRRCLDGSMLLFHLGVSGHIVGVSGFGSVREIGRGVKAGQLMIERMSKPGVAALENHMIELKTLIEEVVATA